MALFFGLASDKKGFAVKLWLLLALQATVGPIRQTM